MKITKAVIPCGGMGTRFLPITKAVPKEILPVIDTPVLGHIVSEAIDSGLTDILIVLGKGKEAIRHYFTPDPDLEQKMRDSGKAEFADILHKIGRGARITFATQKQPLGSGDAVLYAEEFCGAQPFCLAWGDDLIYAKNPVMGQLAQVYSQYGKNVLGVQTVLDDTIVKYGVADISGANQNPQDRVYKTRAIIEKPPLDKLPSRLAALGRYVLTPEIFNVIRRTPTGKGGELQLTDSLNILAGGGKVVSYDFIGKRYDMGDKLGSVCAIVDYAARSPDFGSAFKNWLSAWINS
ncbi:MAG: UTP--glucose-1-phosphate uridylyltransferase [Firmicutes bacterium]|nr:UTP--glucose-1-phosphate uridylyltransferase [Bacillota bacterium]